MKHKENCLGSWGYKTRCDCPRNEKFRTKEDAISTAKEWAKTESYVAIIESRGEFFVENEANMIRNWERIVWRHEK